MNFLDLMAELDRRYQCFTREGLGAGELAQKVGGLVVGVVLDGAFYVQGFDLDYFHKDLSVDKG